MFTKAVGRFFLMGAVFVFLFALFSFAYAMPSVIVGHPNGGQCFVPGSPVTISWNGTEYDHVAIAYRTETEGQPPAWNMNSSAWNIAHPVSGGSYNWTNTTAIPTGVPYKIWIEAHSATHGTVAVDSSDMSFGFASSCGATTTATSTADTIAPTAPIVSVSVVSSSAISISWSGATDNIGVTGYKIYRNGIYLTYTASLSYQDAGLLSATSYSYAVSAYDAVGNMSPQSAAASATTHDATLTNAGTTATSTADTTAPVISAVQPVNIIGPGAQIKWTTDDLSDSRVAYGTASASYPLFSESRCDTGGNVTSHCVNLTGLLAGTMYYYKVQSRNAAALDAHSIEYAFVSASSPATTTEGATTTTTNTTTTTTTTSSSTTATSTSNIITSIITSTITGKATNASGIGIPDIWINAHQYATGKFAQTKSAMDGSYALSVAAGEWSVNAYSDQASIYSYTQGAKYVNMPAAGGALAVNFILDAFDGQITGSIVNSAGQVISDAYGYISTVGPKTPIVIDSIASTTSPLSFGGPVTVGNFNFRVPQGTYTVTAYFPPDAHYAAPPSQIVIVGAGEIKKIHLTVGRNDAIISGFLKDVSVAAITGFDPVKIKVYVSSRTGGWRNAAVDATKGTFSVTVGAGIWYLGVWADSGTGYAFEGADREVIIGAGETRTIDLFLSKTNSVIAGTVTAGGKTLAGVWVSADTRGFSAYDATASPAAGSVPFTAGASSGPDGAFKISVPPGTYFIHAYYSQTAGYLNPPETSVTVAAGQTASVALAFRKTDAVISGFVTANDKGVSAFVHAWSESGGHASGRSDESGRYSLTVAQSDTWHISAGREAGGIFYKAADAVIVIQSESAVSQDMVLLPLATAPAQAVERVVEAAKPQMVELLDGAKTTLPANALGESGSANVIMKPVVEVPSFGASTVVGSGYEVSAKTAAGAPITVLNAEVTVIIPYNEEELAGKGLRAEDLVMSFFDETVNAWKPLEKQVIDKISKTVSGTVGHLTLFALVAPADTTPPKTPSGISVSVDGKAVTLAWTNPTADFHHVKIYRSAKEGELGAVAFNYLTGSSQIDALKEETAYYVVRAVDLAGNESVNIAQHKAQGGTVSAAADNSAVSSGILLIRAEGDYRVYAVIKNVKRHIPSAAIFTASGFQWADVQTISAQSAAAYATSNLVKALDNSKVYVIQNGEKRWIQSVEEFNAAGYKWDLIITVSAAELSAYADAAGIAFSPFTKDLRQGSRGSEVRALQKFLSKDKTVYPEGKVTGYYGKLTQAAVQKFQEKYGIAETSGTAGQKTREKINQLSAQ